MKLEDKLPRQIEDSHEDPMNLFIRKEEKEWQVGYSSEHGYYMKKGKTKEEAIQRMLKMIKEVPLWPI